MAPQSVETTRNPKETRHEQWYPDDECAGNRIFDDDDHDDDDPGAGPGQVQKRGLPLRPGHGRACVRDDRDDAAGRARPADRGVAVGAGDRGVQRERLDQRPGRVAGHRRARGQHAGRGVEVETREAQDRSGRCAEAGEARRERSVAPGARAGVVGAAASQPDQASPRR